MFLPSFTDGACWGMCRLEVRESIGEVSLDKILTHILLCDWMIIYDDSYSMQRNSNCNFNKDLFGISTLFR